MKKVTRLTSPPPSHDAIAGMAQQLWEQDGRQTGRDLEYWLQAERQLSSPKPPATAATSRRIAKPAAWAFAANAAIRR